jgi:hypothetical protein
MYQGRQEMKDKKEISIDEALEKSCPEGYLWECWMCKRKNGSTIPCSGREINNDK